MNFNFHRYIPFFMLAIFFVTIQSNSQAQSLNNQSIWDGIGGKSTWLQTDFILFVAKGNEVSPTVTGSRKFLLNKANGDVRFEGKNAQNDQYVVLFNYHSQKLKKIFKNQIEIKATAEDQALIENVLSQFNEDTSLLFLQTFLEKAGSILGKPEQKISNSEKLIAIPFKSQSLLNKALAGKILVNKDNFQLRNLNLNHNAYLVDGHKDVGAGLTLPTVFKNTTDDAKSCTYTLVASFTEIEESKFSDL